MGSTSDLEVMTPAIETLEQFGIEVDKRVISAHRAPHELMKWAESARERGLSIIIAGAGGAAHRADTHRVAPACRLGKGDERARRARESGAVRGESEAGRAF